MNSTTIDPKQFETLGDNILYHEGDDLYCWLGGARLLKEQATEECSRKEWQEEFGYGAGADDNDVRDFVRDNLAEFATENFLEFEYVNP